MMLMQPCLTAEIVGTYVRSYLSKSGRHHRSGSGANLAMRGFLPGQHPLTRRFSESRSVDSRRYIHTVSDSGRGGSQNHRASHSGSMTRGGRVLYGGWKGWIR
jgi:hypothetical protein